MRIPFRIISEELPQPHSVAGNIPKISSYHIPYTNKISWRGAAWWMALQWYDAKHAYVYCMEIHSKNGLDVVLRCFCDDIHWLYLLKGRLSLNDKYTQQKLQEGFHAQYITLTDRTTLSAGSGRHILVGFTVAKGWLSRYMTDGLDFLPPSRSVNNNEASKHTIRPPVRTTPAMQAEILSLMTLPLSARLSQDSAIYQPVSQLVELERVSYLKAEDPPVVSGNRCAAIAEAVQRYVIKSIQHGAHIPPISEIASHFHVHPDYLSRCHRMYYGVGLKQFIREKLLHKAYELLLTGEKVGDVAFKLGFWDVSAFGKAFKQLFQFNPREVGQQKRS